MPPDLFVGKSSVQTNIYVFRVGEAHQKDDTVKFIDFSVDGYTRTNRKKASCNLRDTDHAKERYAELVDLVRFGKDKLNIFTKNEYYEGKIDPENGADWNQTAPIDTIPLLDDFKKTVGDYFAWEVSNLLKESECGEKQPKETDTPLNQKLQTVRWGEYTLRDLFSSQNGDFDIQKTHINGKGIYVITAGSTNCGVLGKTDIKARVFKKNTITVDMFGNAFYRQFDYKMVTHARVFSLKPNFNITERQGLFLANSLNCFNNQYGFDNMCSWEKIKSKTIYLPITTDGKIDFDFMEFFMAELETEKMTELTTYLKARGFC